MSNRKNADDGDRSFSLGNTLLTALAAFTGSVLGNGVRTYLQARATDERSSHNGFDDGGDMDLTITGVVSTTIAATALAFAADRRRPLVGFIIGASLSAAAGDAPDRMIADLLRSDPDGYVPMETEEDPEGI